MKVRLRKVGNSYTVTVPREIVDELHLEEGGDLDIVVREDRVELKPTTSRWDRLTAEARTRAAERGLTEEDVMKAIREIRGRD